MGSLMAGWDSPTSDPKLQKIKRNQSLTKDEIEAYWRAKKKTEEEHLKAVSSPSDSVQKQEISTNNESEIKYQRSNSLPMATTKTGLMEVDEETSLEKFIKKQGWWTRSTSAFLNEPPVLEGGSKSYAAQFHVANLAAASSKSDADTGIRTC
ncbi:hypothetical protein WN943_008960 [Citrus x changshan-huyou]